MALRYEIMNNEKAPFLVQKISDQVFKVYLISKNEWYRTFAIE